MRRCTLLLLTATLAPGAALAADRAIAVSPMVQSSWAFETHVSGARLRPHLAVGFWQRSSGAKPGVGANFVTALEYQLPEAAPARVRSATFQFSGKQSQCVGAEPVVIDVYAYAADGKALVSDTSAGTRVAQFSANCTDNPAFARPIDVTAIVRQLSVPAGVRHVGFNIRKANNRQGPGLFGLTAGKLTVVLSDQAVAQPPLARSPGVAPGAAVVGAALPAARTAARPMPVAMPDRGLNAPERAAAAQARAAAASSAGVQRGAVLNRAAP